MFDTTVIGAGPNGLSAALVMQQAGRSVIVFERSDSVGGAATTQDLTLPGFRHDLGAAVHPLGAASPLFQSLPLEEHGLSWLKPEIPLAHPLDGGRVAVLHHSIDSTAESLEQDGPRYLRVVGDLVGRWDLLADVLFGPILRVPSQPTAMASFGWRGILPAATVARSLKTDQARALLAGLAAHTPMPLTKAGNTAVALVLAAMAHINGWPIAGGGSQAVADALASILLEAGGTIETGWEVKSLTDITTARQVMFDTGPRAMATIAGDRMSPRIRNRYRRYRHGPGAFKVDYALAGPVPWESPECRQAATLHIGGTTEEIGAAERAVWLGRATRSPFVIVSQPTVVDPTRAPPGQHVLWAYCHVPAGSKTDMTDPIENQIERFAPGFRNLILDRHVMGPAALEQWNPNLVDGDIAGGHTDRLGLLFRPTLTFDPYSVGRGLYLCSSAAPPGPGVHGMSGYHAAQAALQADW